MTSPHPAGHPRPPSAPAPPRSIPRSRLRTAHRRRMAAPRRLRPLRQHRDPRHRTALPNSPRSTGRPSSRAATLALPCSSGENRILRLAASIAAGIPVDLNDALSGLDHASITRVTRAVRHANGTRPDEYPAGDQVSSSQDRKENTTQPAITTAKHHHPNRQVQSPHGIAAHGECGKKAHVPGGQHAGCGLRSGGVQRCLRRSAPARPRRHRPPPHSRRLLRIARPSPTRRLRPGALQPRHRRPGLG